MPSSEAWLDAAQGATWFLAQGLVIERNPGGLLVATPIGYDGYMLVNNAAAKEEILVAKQKSSAAVETPVEETVEQTTPAQSAGRARLEHIEPAQFAALRDELGLSNKQVAEAIGRTLSRVSELTNSQGASINTWTSYEQSLREYAANMPKAEEADGS